MDDYLNPLTVSLHLLAYLAFSSIAFKLHKNLKTLSEGNYQIGPVECVLFMWVPFFYIFWNTYCIEKACRNLRYYGLKSPTLLGLHSQTWLILIASPLIYPDNMDKVAPSISVTAFIVALVVMAKLERNSYSQSVSFK